jgi:acetyltransferase-like isoleucine patch superfamily enzyme
MYMRRAMGIFTNKERNKNLREQILKYHISSVMTDDERAALLGLPEGCRIRENAKIISPENLKCGKYIWIGEGAILDASGGLEIGGHTTIGSYVLVWSHDSHLANVSLNNVISSPLIQRKPTKIGKGCFIAGHSVIYSGVTLGDKVVVLPMSVITRDTPGNCIVAGAPARKLRDLSDEEIREEVKRNLAANSR